MANKKLEQVVRTLNAAYCRMLFVPPSGDPYEIQGLTSLSYQIPQKTAIPKMNQGTFKNWVEGSDQECTLSITLDLTTITTYDGIPADRFTLAALFSDDSAAAHTTTCGFAPTWKVALQFAKTCASNDVTEQLTITKARLKAPIPVTLALDDPSANTIQLDFAYYEFESDIINSPLE